MSAEHTTAGWARALTITLTAAAGGATLVDAALRLLSTGAAPLGVNQGFANSKFTLPDGRVARPRLVLAELTSHEWDRVEDAIAALPDGAALAGTSAISDQLTDPANTAGIPLIPAPSDISHTCTCTPEAATLPCVHSVAVGLLLIDRIRTSPGALFTVRGRPHQHLRRRLHAQHVTAVSQKAVTQPAAPAPPAPLQQPSQPGIAIPAQVAGPTVPIPQPVDLDLTDARPVLAHGQHLPPSPLPRIEALTALAADAAERAEGLLNRGEAVTCQDTASDVARFITRPHGGPFRQAAMDLLGLDVVGMSHLTLAYTYGGPAGAAAYLDSFTIGHDVLAHAQADIQPLRPAATATVECEGNRLTDQAAGVQLRYGADGRWHPYLAPYGIWQPVPGPSADAAQAYRAARAAAPPPRRAR
ncbi:hypothetical protein AB0N09_30975 [Streptomyces erythrochromogenes]|uniref:hypothetical protein n=1 Tax=Streptomyces erythrochromogenes TaxID=285574 RepID=UPI00341950F1